MQTLLSQKQQTLSPFLSGSVESTLNFEHFQKKQATFIVDVSLKLHSLKNMIR